MRLLVDTHVMLWWLRDDRRLSRQARSIVADAANELLWSIASSWEIAVKLRIGKLELDRPLERLFADLISEQGLELLPVSHEHCTRLCNLPLHHRDPFDRMLVVQAQHAGVPLMTADPKFKAYDIRLLW